MHIGNKLTSQTRYSLKDAQNNTTVITKVDNEKDLGVNFQSNMKFNIHISEKRNKSQQENLWLDFQILYIHEQGNVSGIVQIDGTSTLGICFGSLGTLL